MLRVPKSGRGTLVIQIKSNIALKVRLLLFCAPRIVPVGLRAVFAGFCERLITHYGVANYLFMNEAFRAVIIKHVHVRRISHCETSD